MDISRMPRRLLVIPAAVCLAAALCSCSGAGGSSQASAAAPQASKSAPSSALAARFSYTIDGTTFSDTATDDFANAIYRRDPGVINFTLMPTRTTTPGIPAQISFTVADHGTTTVHGPQEGPYAASIQGGAYASHENVAMTVTITDSNASHVAGTFSGTLKELNTEKVLPVTGGTFDLPYSPHSHK
jgi:ABC-type phosphate transport system substrate-binding protein